MVSSISPPPSAVQILRVFKAEDLRVDCGANLGDGLGLYDDLALDDIYQFTATALGQPIRLGRNGSGPLQICKGSKTGRIGATIALDSLVTFMATDGGVMEALVLVELTDDTCVAETYLLPLTPHVPRQRYTLIGKTREGLAERFARLACVAFSRGTQITLADGTQRRIETIRPGDRLLTRDAGAQEVRWIGQTTSQSVGTEKPVLVRAGALCNERDVIFGPDHRLLVHDRDDLRKRGPAKYLVRARDLINGIDIVEADNGFVDYFMLLLNRHHIVFADHIAAESLLLTPVTRTVLPNGWLERRSEIAAGHFRTASGLRTTGDTTESTANSDLAKPARPQQQTKDHRTAASL
ncbi:Hint domain-containing protein [Phaeobacter sp.]|uniref:Hint domain-containing protein n=1 Tax=Phaeobacter sp. TaxID=1902409 RepID=UPI0025CDB338|nr:Hint domain-containing protein [Phaeobacter sp.]